MPLGALEVSKPNAGPEAAGQPLSRGNEPDERVHGRNKGCQRDQKFRNEKRNMTEGQRRLRGYNDKTFRRHFKVIKRRFWQMAKEMAPRLELGDLGKLVALKSSGSWVPIECRLAVALRTLAGSNFQDKEDVYGVRTMGYKSKKRQSEKAAAMPVVMEEAGRSEVKYLLKRATERCWREVVNKQNKVEKELRSQLAAEETRARVEADILRWKRDKKVARLKAKIRSCMSYKLREATTRATVRMFIGRKAEQLEAWLTHAVGDDDSWQSVYAEGGPGARPGARSPFRRSKWDADVEKLVQMVLPYGNLMIKWPSVEEMLKGQGEEPAAVGLSTTEDKISSTLDLKLVLQHRARLLLKEGLIKPGESLSIQLVADAT
eukprot:jgi/Tetstr1/436162/TSEL_025008.t1